MSSKELKAQIEQATDADIKALLQKKLDALEASDKNLSFEQVRSFLEKSAQLGASLSGQSRDFDHFSAEDSPSSAIFRATTGEARILIVKNWADSKNKTILPNATMEDVEGVTPSDFVTPLYKGSLSDGSQYYQRHGKSLTDQPNIGWFGLPASLEVEKDTDYLCEFNGKGYVASAEAM